mmetsp:Transcript_6221/g.13595  ORF Transcript_6221/g.13595 Transcript_6221/m.13595 type:complete len:288 (+) Transcript_6221:109-972(+)|eukprot:CAMPEP_0202901496 /NCGR_PEP_ID=MMETSP1392-20130828/14284_1 /ASSEMBLY_ACC=CAM_ASM_000868 /TAXON_ID=225041 /ORGANISM="Chlamydomonas chlamydogama, Strain SAG 11-48b" /LENGTH=287 /DNA_ID=CAMNT_0049588059 /DNA_START=96 /DNA_END=959 /DNA_ORIENTATION=+
MSTLAEIFPEGPVNQQSFSEHDDWNLLQDINIRSFISAAVLSLPRPSFTRNPPSAYEFTKSLVHRSQSSRQARKRETALTRLGWVQELLEPESGFQQVFDISGLTKPGDPLGEDHLLRNMARRDMLKDNLVLLKTGPAVCPAEGEQDSCMQVLNMYALGHDVCGHKGIVHGGFTATIIDETFGYLLYLAKLHNALDFDIVLTAQLDVSYKKPIPASSMVVCSAQVESVQGRKIWVNAELRDQHGCGTLFATARALFVTPKKDAPAPQPAGVKSGSSEDGTSGTPADV